MNSGELSATDSDVLCAKVQQMRDFLLEWLQVDLEGVCFLVKGVKYQDEAYIANRNKFYPAVIEVDAVQYMEGRAVDVSHLKNELDTKNMFILDDFHVFKEQDDKHAVIQIGSLNGTNMKPLFSPLNYRK